MGPVDDYRMRNPFGAHRGDCLVFAHACLGGVAWSAWVGRGADAVVGGRDDRRSVDDVAGRVAVGWPGRGAAVDVACDRKYGKPGRERGGGRADGDRSCDCCVAVVRADRVIRTADATSPPRRISRHATASRAPGPGMSGSCPHGDLRGIAWTVGEHSARGGCAEAGLAMGAGESRCRWVAAEWQGNR